MGKYMAVTNAGERTTGSCVYGDAPRGLAHLGSSHDTPPRMDPLRLALLGYGTVGRALHELLERNRAALAAEHDITFVICGIASRRMGWIANAKGLDRR